MQSDSRRHSRDLRPPASAANVSARMKAQRERDTGVERSLRSVLHARGLRYRLHQRVIPGTRREVDLVFTKARVAVFVDGCFWHACPEHATWPKANAGFWRAKIEENVRRDRDTDERLRSAGWLVLRVWEHEAPDAAAERIAQVVMHRLQ
jgi:DNA mismatch endonuclease, patch repair protein